MPADGTCAYCQARRPMSELEPHITEEGKLVCRNAIECVRQEIECVRQEMESRKSR